MTPAEVLSEFFRLDAAVNLANNPVDAHWAADYRYAFADEHGLSDGEGYVDYERVEELYESIHGVDEWLAA